MHPMLPPNITPEEAARLLPALQAALAPVQGVVEGALAHDPSQPKPMGGAPAPAPVPSAAEVYADRPASLGKTPEPVMNLSPEDAAVILGGPLVGRAAGAALPALEAGIPAALRAMTSKPTLTAGPMAATGATAAAAASLPSGTGMTPWETMQGQWNQRRSDYQAQIAEQQAQMEAARAAHLSRAPTEPQRPQATANKSRGANAVELYERAMAQYPGLLKQHQDALGPVLAPFEERIAGLRGNISGIDEEIKNSQTPIREKNPMLGVLAPPLAWTAAALTGGKVGKFARGLQESRAMALNRAAQRGAEQVDRGSRSAFTGPSGRASAAELQAAEGKGVAPLLTPAAAGTAGASVGALEGSLAPLGLAAIDAISAPGGSPLAISASEAPYTQQFWMQAAPEMAVAGGASGMAALLAALKKPGGGRFAKPQFGPPDVPTDQIRGMAAAARQATEPKPKAKPKPKPKVKEE